MNNSSNKLLKNFTYVLSANSISLFISVLSTVILPKIIGIDEYGYWQLYIFYLSYIGFFHFGLIDGIYLKYGGTSYNNLDKNLFTSQFWILFIIEVLISCTILGYSFMIVSDRHKSYIFMIIAVCIIIVIPKTLISFILQLSNRMKDYSKILTSGRTIFGFIVVVIIILGCRDFRIIILVDVLAKIISLIIAIVSCKDIVFGKSTKIVIGLKEAIDNIRVGIKLMFANIASLLIIGVVRFGMEQKWDIETFGKVSLTLSISNMLMIFINAIGTVLYPILRNTPVERLPQMYIKIRNLLMIPLIGMLVAFYPAKWIFILWLPKYIDALPYMALLFPICIYESKMSMLINTYFNTLRKEKLMMQLNWATLIISAITTYLFIFIFGNLTLSVLSITLLLAFKCILSEIMLAKVINISVSKDIMLEVLITAIFIVSAWFMGNIYGMLIFIFSYGMYLLIKKKDVSDTVRMLKLLKGPSSTDKI